MFHSVYLLTFLCFSQFVLATETKNEGQIDRQSIFYPISTESSRKLVNQLKLLVESDKATADDKLLLESSVATVETCKDNHVIRLAFMTSRFNEYDKLCYIQDCQANLSSKCQNIINDEVESAVNNLKPEDKADLITLTEYVKTANQGRSFRYLVPTSKLKAAIFKFMEKKGLLDRDVTLDRKTGESSFKQIYYESVLGLCAKCPSIIKEYEGSILRQMIQPGKTFRDFFDVSCACSQIGNYKRSEAIYKAVRSHYLSKRSNLFERGFNGILNAAGI